MRKIFFKTWMSKEGQTPIELAIFGTIVIFVVSLIIRTILATNYQQDTQIKAMRQAMMLSYEYSEGLRGKSKFTGGGERYDGNASRNSASVTVINDRLTPDSNKYGTVERVPYINSANASYSRNLFMSIGYGEYHNLPTIDLLINGVHIPLTTAGFKTVRVTPDTKMYGRIVNHVKEKKWCDGVSALCNNPLWESGSFNADVDRRFDLDRDNIPDVDASPTTLRENFSWQWYEVTPKYLNVRGRDGKVYSKTCRRDPCMCLSSVDVDGDLSEEVPLMMFNVSNGGPDDRDLQVLDSNEGDVDLGINPEDVESGEVKAPGLTANVRVWTRTQNTYLLIDNGKLIDLDASGGKRFIRNTQMSDQVDLIEREVQLSTDTGRFCSGGAPNQNPDIWGPVNFNPPNPVEACGNCYSEANKEKTCMDPSNLMIYVRSKIQGQRGRIWSTDKSNDPKVKYGEEAQE